MELIAVAIAVVAFCFLFVPASLLPLLAGAALGSDTIDGADRRWSFEPIGGSGWSDDEPIAA
jgi:hypothetical protein